MAIRSTRRDLLAGGTALAALALVPTPRRLRAQSPSDGPGLEDLQADLESALQRHRVVGASAAIYHRGEITTAAAGLTNTTTGVELTKETVMHIGSITKTLNTTLVMQLVDEGKVDLDAPVLEYVPDFKVADPEATKAITVGMLLNHTTGIDGEIIPDHGPDQENIRQAVERAADMGQLFDPGKDCSYCNTAMVVAGHVAERVLGESWYLLMEDRIFSKLGLEHAIVQPEDALLHRASVGHFLNPATGEQTRTSFAFLPRSFAPAGATAMMSAADLLAFGVAHLRDGEGLNGERLLSEKSARAMRTRTADMKGLGAVRSFGRGFMLGEHGDVGHGGGGPGILSWLTIHPEKDFAIAVLTNSAHGMTVIAEICNAWMKSATGDEPLPSRRYPELDSDVEPRLYAGTYEDIAAEHKVTEKDDGIFFSTRAKSAFYDGMSTAPTPSLPLVPVGDHAFAIKLPEALAANAPQTVMSFVNPEGDGRMRHISMGGRLYRRTA